MWPPSQINQSINQSTTLPNSSFLYVKKDNLSSARLSDIYQFLAILDRFFLEQEHIRLTDRKDHLEKQIRDKTPAKTLPPAPPPSPSSGVECKCTTCDKCFSFERARTRKSRSTGSAGRPRAASCSSLSTVSPSPNRRPVPLEQKNDASLSSAVFTAEVTVSVVGAEDTAVVGSIADHFSTAKSGITNNLWDIFDESVFCRSPWAEWDYRTLD